MLILEHKKQLVAACDPQSPEQFREYWSQIRPVKFGNAVSWSGANTYTLAQYQVPQESSLIVLRTECYTVNLTSGAADYGMFEPPPPGEAWWVYFPPDGSGLNPVNVTSQLMNTHLALDADELLIFSGGNNAALLGAFDAPSDGATRIVRALVYSYLVGPAVADLIGASKVLIT